MNQLVRELQWLVEKVQKDEAFIQKLEEFFGDHHHKWSRSFAAHFMDNLQERQDQLDFEDHRLEKLSWRIIEQRELDDLVADRIARHQAWHRRHLFITRIERDQ